MKIKNENEERIANAYTNMEAELFQGVTLSEEQYKELNDESIANLANIVATRRGWQGAIFAGVEPKKGDTYRVVFKKLVKKNTNG